MKKSSVLFTISFLLLVLAIFLAFRYSRMVEGERSGQRTSRTTYISALSPGNI